MVSPKFVLYCDGACLPNPKGHITVAYILHRDDQQIQKSAAIIGTPFDGDSEAAEYFALIEGLNAFTRSWVGHGSELEIRSDCLSVIARVRGMFPEMRHQNLHRTVLGHIANLKRSGVDVTITWIARSDNAECDALAKSFREGTSPRGGQAANDSKAFA